MVTFPDSAIPPPKTLLPAAEAGLPRYALEYEGIWRVIMVVQFVFGMILSEDEPARDVPLMIACALHWIIAGYIYCRRPDSPSKFDLFMVRFGVVPLRIALGVLGWWLPMRI
jgi:hypothetical protein